MRGGTSKGPFFLAADLPADPQTRDRVLLAAMGSPDQRQIDGIGGGDALTSKVAIVSPSARPGIDVEYLFAQVSVTEASVDTGPNCGNMLAGVGPFAIEHGLVKATVPSTRVRVFNINTQSVVEALVPTPNGEVTYEGDVRIDGVPGTGAGIVLNFVDAAGAKTGKLLPTGVVSNVIDGITVSCIDFAVPMVLIPAAALGKTGHETKQTLDADKALLERLEALRRRAAVLMGMGDVARKVLPKLGLLAVPYADGHIASRYFTPWNCHAAHAVTGALCVAAACYIPGSVAATLVRRARETPDKIVIEHPAGTIETRVQTTGHGQLASLAPTSAGIVRTVRPLLSGMVHVPMELLGEKKSRYVHASAT